MKRKINLLISECLCGVPCRYDGKDNALPCLKELEASFNLIPVCPEVLGGLDTPRQPAERCGSNICTCDGTDVTDAFLNGAQLVLDMALQNSCKVALMKAKSPSCGYKRIYDGTFTRTLTNGHGVTVERLLHHDIEIYTENDILDLLEKYK